MNSQQMRALQDKLKKIDESAWTIIETLADLTKLKHFFSKPIVFGLDGKLVTHKLYDLLGNDDLFDTIGREYDKLGPNADARETVKIWILNHLDDPIWNQLNDSGFEIKNLEKYLFG